MNDTPSDGVSPADFLSALHGDAEGYLTVCRFTPIVIDTFKVPDQREEAIKKSLALAETNDVYFNVGLQSVRPTGTDRGGAKTVGVLPGLWLDMDIDGPTHKAKNNPPDVESAEGLFQGFVDPSISVKTGGGFHVYWLTKTPCSGKDKDRAVALCGRLNEVITKRAKEKGWSVGNTADAPRVLRLPWTWNRKKGIPKPFKVKAKDFGHRYTLDELEEKIKSMEPVSCLSEDASDKQPKEPAPILKEASSKSGLRFKDWLGLGNRPGHILASLGWKHHHDDPEGRRHYTRPGKDVSEGASGNWESTATGGRFHVFTDSVKDVDEQRAYSLVQLVAAQKHAGDEDAADKELWQEFGAEYKGLTPSPAMVGDPVGTPEPDDRPIYVRPQWSEVLGAIKGSPIELYMNEARKVSSMLQGDLLLVDGLFLAGMCLANNQSNILTCEGDDQYLTCNVYVLKLVPMGGGKGLSTGFLLPILTTHLKFVSIYGDSCPAIIKTAAGAPGGGFGYYHQNEIKHILDSGNPTAVQVCTFFQKSWDQHSMEFKSCPKGQLNHDWVSPAAPSMFVEGQPSVFEAAAGRSAIDGGMMRRFIVVVGGKRKIRKEGAGNGMLVADVFRKAYWAKENFRTDIIGGPTRESKRMEPHLDYMTEGETGAWNTLVGEYHKKFALMLDPDAFKTRKLSDEALDKAMILCEWLYADVSHAIGLCHRNRAAAERAELTRFIAENPGCSDRDCYRKMDCSVFVFRNDFAPTLIAAGYAVRRPEDLKQSGRWYPPDRHSLPKEKI